MKLVIPGRLPSLNEVINANRKNRYAGAKVKKDTQNYISGFIHSQLKDVKFGNAVSVDFKWYEANKKRDLDNICSSKKMILDALVTCGIIQTDGWRGVSGFTDEFFVDKDNPRIEVIIEEAK